MAQITLNNGEQRDPAFPDGGTNTFTDAPGTSANPISNETIYVGGGTQTFGASFNDGGDTIVLSGTASQFQISREFSTIVITNGAGLTVRFPVPDASVSAANAARFVFNGGTSGNTADDVTFTLVNTGTAINFTNTAAGSTAVPVGTTPISVTPTTPAPTVPISVTSTNVVEGSGNIVYTLTLATAQTTPVTVTVNVGSGATNGATSGTDFTSITNQSITFAPGETVKTVTVTVLDDNIAEGAETVTLTITGVTPTAGSTVTATISDNETGTPPNNGVSLQLSTGSDTLNGAGLNDRFTGTQDITLPGKLLSSNDVVNGGDGSDLLELFNTRDANFNTVANVLEDGDFTNVTSVERLESNYNQITLGTEALQAGLVSVNTTSADFRTTSGAGPNSVGGNSFNQGVNLILDAAFVQALNATLSNRSTDLVSLNLVSAAGSSIDTGSSGTQTDVNGNVTSFNPIDQVTFSGTVTNPLRVTFTSTAVGSGNSRDGAGALAVSVQSEDGSDALTGGIVRFDDEGIRFTGAQFDVRDVSGTARGTFGDVVLGTVLQDFVTGVAAGSYINAGGGDDFVTGAGGADFLVGGAGNDVLDGQGGVDSILGGGGNDTITGGAGIDALLDGGEGSDTYVYGDGEFVAAEVINDSGTGASDIDYIAITSATALTDAQFAGRTGIEGLATNVNNAAGTELTVGANAQASGIRTVFGTNDDVNASAYTVGLTVYGSGSITTGTGADTVALQTTLGTPGGIGSSSTAFQAYTGAVVLGDGNDTLIAGYALPGGGNNVLTGGAGSDTLILGGVNAAGQGGTAPVNNLAATAYVNPFGAAFTGFETVTIAAPTGANRAVSYTLTFVDANVDAATPLIVNGSALRSGVTLAGLDGVSGTADDVTANEVLTVNASALTGTRAVIVTGGASADSLTGGAGADTLIGGLGNDALVGGAGADTLTGGAGNDTLTGGAGTDTADGGDGNDSYVFADTELTAADVIADSGAIGSDSLFVTSSTAITDALFTNKAGVEAISSTVAGASNDATAEVTLGVNAQAMGLTTVISGDDDLDASAFTSGLIVVTGLAGGAGGNVLTGSGNDVVYLFSDGGNQANGGFASNAATYNFGAGDDRFFVNYALSNRTPTINGGTGNDTIFFGGLLAPYGIARGSVAGATFSNPNMTNVERLVLAPAERSTATLLGSTTVFTVTIAEANVAAGTTFFVDGLALTTTTTGAGVDGMIGTTDDVVNADTLVLNGGLETDGSLDVTGGAGADTITGGQGADVLRGGAGADTINGGAGADTIEGGDGNDILRGQAGFDTIRGGAGNDRIEVLVTEFNSDNDNVDGGADNDTLQLTGTVVGPQDIADVGFNGRFANIEQVTLVGAVGGTQFTYNAGFFSETAGVRVINLGANTSGSTVSVANYSVAGATLNDTLVNGNNAVFIGSNFADTFNLGVTNTATGGGTDVVRAGGGNDTINFGSTLVGTAVPLGTDDIVDGGTGSDTLNVSGNGVVGTGTTQTINLQAAVAAGVVNSGIFSVETLNLAPGAVFTDNTTPTNDVAGSATSYTVNIADTTFDGTTASITIDGSGLRAGVILTLAGGQSATTGDEVLTVNGGGVAVVGHSIVATGGAAGDSLTGGAGNDTLTGGAGNDTLTGNGGVDTVDGGTGDDTISGGAGNDVLTGGTGIDTITGGAGADTINLGTDGARDTVVINTGDAPRADIVGIEQINGFQTGSRGAGADAVAGNGDDTYTATSDLIQFGAFGIINENSTSITNGVVQQGSVLQNAINSSTSLLAAIQLVEQEFNADAVLNQGVIAFTYGGNTYIGVIEDTDPTAGITEAFTSIVQINGLSGVTGLIDDVAIPGTGIGLYV